MAAPATIDEFFDLMRKSGVVEENRLDAYLERLGTTATLPEDLGKAAGVLVRDGVLTHFQAEQILAGKWRRFTIGKYKVLERLGSGGMGSVYLCEHLFMRRRVAVKVLPTAKAEDPSALERFYREARAVAALDHPNIVRAYDIDQDDRLHFLVMEYIDGSSLQEVVKRHGPMDVNRVANYIKQAAAGLQHAHIAAGLIHRDVKPGNILLDRKGVIKVLDMGLARFFNDEDQPITQKFDENVLGTADYLAPEQALDSHNVDIRADIYSLGATFYFCLTGNTPFDGTVAQKLIWHQTRPPRPVRDVRPDIPEGIATIVEKMMSKDPSARYATPLEVEDVLVPWTQEPIGPPPDHEMPRLSPAAMGLSGAPESGQAPTSSPSSSSSGPPSRRYDSKPAFSNPRPPSSIAGKPSNSVGRLAPSSASMSRARAENLPRESSNSLSFEREAQAPETDDAHGHADTAPQPIQRPVPIPVARSVPTTLDLLRKQPVWIWAIGGAVAFTLVSFFAWRMSTRDSDQQQMLMPIDRIRPVKTTPTTLKVTRQAGPNCYETVREALYVANPGDTILVVDDEHEEELLLDIGRYGDDVTVEAGNASHSVHWVCPKNPKQDRFLSFKKLKNFRLKGFHFDAKSNVVDVATISGPCPGLVFEDDTFSGYSHAAVMLWNAEGRGDKNPPPITFQRCRFLADRPVDSGIRFCTVPNVTSSPNQEIAIRESRFEGPFEAAIRFAAPSQHIEISKNRFFRCGAGVLYERATPPYLAQMTIDSNVFAELPKGALDFQSTPLSGVSSRVVVSNNLFVHCGAMGQLDERDVLEEGKLVFGSGGNYRDKETKEGNLPVQCKVADAKLPTDPADDQRFLRYPHGDVLESLGINGVPVGVPQPE